MRKRVKDDWEKPRTRNQYFTEAEREFIAEAFRQGRKSRDVARELKAATRTIDTHYAQLRGDADNYRIGRGRHRGYEKRKDAPPRRAPLPNRFYTSTFEL